MSKILVVSYSWTGTCSRVARQLCAQRPGWQHGQIKLEKPRNGRIGYWRCVLDSVLRRRPAIVYRGPIPTQFDAVVLVSPIWAFSLASPLRSFVRTRRDHLPHVAMVSVMGGAGASNAVREVERLIGRACVMNAAFTMQDVATGHAAEALDRFGNALQMVEDGNTTWPSQMAQQTA
jgi:hypothetical protein